ncbi:amidase [Pseudomonas aeruginosa]|nr:amidase [Pseudomonas aeruginosa]
MTALHDLPGTRLLALFARRELSPSEYYEHLLAHIQRWEPHLNALYRFDPQRIREQAAAATERWRKGQPKGPLDGLPVTIKELIATAGEPIPLGSAATALQPAPCDAPPAARLREAGAIVLAKTTVPDFGMLSSGLSSFHGVTRNPWNLANNTGGSSSGAAAAAAAGYGPLHLGTDIGGSVRLPAGWCGLVGFKPSLGRIPIDPYYTGRCAGPMTRCMDDCLLLMRYLAQPDARDATSLPPEVLDWSAEPLSVRGLRIGLQLDPGCGLQPDAEIRAAIEAAARLFEEHGAQLRIVEPLMDRSLLDGLNDFWRARLWSELLLLDETRRARVLPYVHAWAEGGARVSGGRCGARFQPDLRDAPARRPAVRRDRPAADADQPGRGLPRRLGLAAERSAATIRAHRLHRAVEYGRTARALDKLRLHGRRHADRPATGRAALRRYLAVAHRQDLRRLARSDPRLAPAAG